MQRSARESDKKNTQEKRVMVHEIDGGGVPEELYNLRQLAEVSIAAGKLPQHQQMSNTENNQGYACTFAMNHNFEQNEHESDKALNYSTKANTTCTKKKWKTEWEESCYQGIRPTMNENVIYPAANTLSHTHNMNNHVSLISNPYQHHLQSYESPYGSDTRHSFTTAQELKTINNNSGNDTLRRNSLVSTSSSLASSSDDDSCHFSYSHKVFDRKKVRRNIENYGSSSLENANSMTNSAESDQGSVESGAEEIHTCPECGKKYSTSSNLARHRQTHR